MSYRDLEAWFQKKKRSHRLDETQLSNEKSLVLLGYIGDYTIQLYKYVYVHPEIWGNDPI